jgi:hypothetical protein
MAVLSKLKTAVRLAVRPIEEAKQKREKGSLYAPVHPNADPEVHLREAAGWLLRAQDHGTDRGVSYGSKFGEGFSALSYPETTGYIICTFLDFAREFGDDDFLRRAIQMGEWESDIQLTSGAVMGGMYNTNPTPAIFNTGMVLLGWASLFRETKLERFRISGERAGKWLLDMQEANGSWIRGNSQFANAQSTVYNVKAAWGLAEMGAALQRTDFIAAAARNAEFALTKQLSNGWFQDCCLEDPQRPLLHTIAYTMQGLIGIARIADRLDFTAAAAKTAKALEKLMDKDGFLPGRIRSDFTEASKWCCLTGSAQTSIVWSDLEHTTGDSAYGAAVDRVNHYLMSRHDIANTDASLRGGVPGSWPVWGDYGKYTILNWATKFFADALLARSPSAMSVHQSGRTNQSA